MLFPFLGFKSQWKTWIGCSIPLSATPFRSKHWHNRFKFRIQSIHLFHVQSLRYSPFNFTPTTDCLEPCNPTKEWNSITAESSTRIDLTKPTLVKIKHKRITGLPVTLVTDMFVKYGLENVANTNTRTCRKVDIVGTVYHLVIYMQSNNIHKVF